MATIYEIPLQPKSQKVTVNLNGVDYKFSTRWNTIANYWILDIYDSSDNKLIMGIPIVTGTDLLGQYGYLDIAKNALLIALTKPVDNKEIDDIPTKTNLGIDSHLYYVTT